MSGMVFLIILFGAALHASWNALVKTGADRFLSAVLVTGGGTIVSALALPFLAQPRIAVWPFVAASVCAEVAYYACLTRAYERGDMSAIYPIMRGTAPLLVAILSLPIVGEPLSQLRCLGILLICGGVAAIAFESHRRSTSGAIRFAILTALMIATCTLIDAVGVRRSGAPAAYTFWIFLLSGIPLVVWAGVRRPTETLQLVRSRAGVGLVGGACLIGSYGFALWAMTRAPVASVAALRETSILFGTFISAALLKERIGVWRYLATGLIVLGALLIRYF